MIVTVSGFPASGTTTVCEGQLIEHRFDGLNAVHLNGGDIFREMADDRDMSLSEFSKHVNNNPKIDEEIDGTLRLVVESFANNDSCRVCSKYGVDDADVLVFESRLAGWIAGDLADVSVWCATPLEVRQERVDGDPSKQDPDQLKEREMDEANRYVKQYGIDIYDRSIYDLVLNTDSLSPHAAGVAIASLAKNTEETDSVSSPMQNPFTEYIPN